MVFKKEFIEHYLELFGGKKKTAVEAYDRTFECLADILFGEGREVCVKGLGTFKIETRKARNSTHPGTGEPFVLPAQRIVKFRQLRLINSEGDDSDTEGAYDGE